VVTATFTLNRQRYNSVEKQDAFYSEVSRSSPVFLESADLP
jgi:hypothetical protein